MLYPTMKTLNQMIEDDSNLLDFVVLPDVALNVLDVSALKAAIIRRCGDAEPYYQIAAQFKFYGALWFNTHDFLFSHAIKIHNATYNPIENYDRIEEYEGESTTEKSNQSEIVNSGSDTTENSENTTNSRTHGGTDSNSETITYNVADTHSGTDSNSETITYNVTDTHGGTTGTNKAATSEKEIAGFNSADYSKSEKLTDSENTTITHGETKAKTGTEQKQSQLSHGETITKTGTESNQAQIVHGETIADTGSADSESSITYGKNTTQTDSGDVSISDSHNSRIHGNIGVTTAAQMIDAEIELAKKFWVYDYIASAFETDNFITAYESYYEGAQWD